MGPLHGVKVIELTGIGPGPFAGTLLSDMGAEVVRVERAELATSASRPSGFVFDGRGRRAITVDLKQPEGVETVLRMVEQADALIEGFRPGVTERLGLGPDACLARNPQLVYGRMTGWGQDGPLAHAAGHDINYIALAGALAHFGRVGQPPTPPINMVGDYGGGGMFLAFGVVCGILEARASGQGQVVDAAMVDGAAYLMGAIWGLRGIGGYSEERGTNLLDTGSPFYDVYETADGEWISLGSLEPQFYAELVELTGLEHDDLPHQMDRSGWPLLRERLTAAFKAQDARRVGRGARGHRRLLRAGAADERSAGRTRTSSPARSSWSTTTSTSRRRAALLAHAAGDPGSGRAAGRAHRSGARRLGLRRRRGRRRCSRPARSPVDRR